MNCARWIREAGGKYRVVKNKLVAFSADGHLEVEGAEEV